MTDYSKMSDFEINKAVANLLEISVSIRLDFSGEKIGGTVKKWLCRVSSGVEFDPCNNPADAWPIIESCGIGLRKQRNGVWVVTQMEGNYPQYDKRPLRTAMIVFLQMQERC